MIDRLILSEDGKTVVGLKELVLLEIPEGATSMSPRDDDITRIACAMK